MRIARSIAIPAFYLSVAAFVLMFMSQRAMCGARPLCVFFVDLAGQEHDDVRDALVSQLLADGCWADKCDDELMTTYALRRGLPAAATVEIARAAVGGDRPAIKRLTAFADKELGADYDSLGYFWHPDGFLIYDRIQGGGAVRITGIAMRPDLRHRNAPQRKQVVHKLTNHGLDKAAQTAILHTALDPLWAQFVP